MNLVPGEEVVVHLDVDPGVVPLDLDVCLLDQDVMVLLQLDACLLAAQVETVTLDHGVVLEAEMIAGTIAEMIAGTTAEMTVVIAAVASAMIVENAAVADLVVGTIAEMNAG